MAFPFTAEGRIAIPISSAEKAHAVAAGVQQWIEQGRVRDVHWEDNVLHFTGDYFLRWDRLWNARRATGDGMGPSSLKFEDYPEQVVIEYALTFRLARYLLLIAAFFVPVFAISGGDLHLLLALPIIALIHGGLWFLTRFDFQSSLRIAATRGMADAAERELHALQTS